MGISWENNEKIMRKSWENHGKIMRNHEKIMRK
jgi:hypothetical protein